MPKTTRTWLSAGAIALTASLLAACGGGGASDVAGGGDQPAADTTLTLVAYAVPEPGWKNVSSAFANTEDGKGVAVTGSYGASGDQSRKVEAGTPADIVNFSVEPDVTRLVKAGKVAEDWNADATKGIPFGSVVTLVVRQGNPKGIRDWDDLLKPGVEVVTPNPLSSGSAKWNLLAPYAAKSNGGQDQQAGLDYLGRLLTGEHLKVRPGSGREATDVFLQGSGDVLIAYENEAINSKKTHPDIEWVTPPQTFKIENPVAVIKGGQHEAKANQLKNFLYTPEGQKAWAEAGFRPVDPAVLEQFADQFPAPQKLWTIADLGGWKDADPKLFDKSNGLISTIYGKATG
ncbi:sulfate ABC transporter substrate-binding protein [Mycolicibacterium sediminis]|uniref:Sulfate ABC transporter substrate-binding protein n=1 Tax=Mycolicibacterium sediminis TaxID=1286180 RepID=A0A7I7QY16_9MYCO|nr:sulfate ABC transporter substrate-binding protein [Mycolicibacterium sediminis]BBY30740.1 sulfate ABC transporter substrate-binding protein [Mycolicibacterium sediminis]